MLTRHFLRCLPAFHFPQLSMIHRSLANSSVPISPLEDFRKKQLWLKFPHKIVTKEMIMNLTDDIQGINIVERINGCFVYIYFPSEEVADMKYEELRKQGIWVDYCGTKMGKHKGLQSGDARETYTDEHANKKLRLRFKAEVSEEDIQEFSEEIKNVKARYQDGTTKAIVTFETPEQAEKHYDLFQVASVQEWPARVYKISSGPRIVKETTELLVKDLKDSETEEDLIEIFPEAKEVLIFYSLFNQRWARIKFRSHEDCVSAFKENSGSRKVNFYTEMGRKEEEKSKFAKAKKQIYQILLANRVDPDQTAPKILKNAQLYGFVKFTDEEDCRQAANDFRELDIQYSFECEFDYKTLVLNGISDWDTVESVNQLFPEAEKIYIHKIVSENGEKTFRNALILFDSEEKCKEALEANARRRLYYRVIK